MLNEIIKRKVPGVLTGYAVACFVILQIADVTFDALGLSARHVRLLLFGMVAGLPIVAYLAWRYDVNGATVNVEKSARPAVELSAIIVVSVGLFVVMFLFWPTSLDDRMPAQGSNAEPSSLEASTTQPSKTVVAVAPLRDHSPSSEFGWLSAGIAEEMRRQISAWEHYDVLHRSESELVTKGLKEMPADILLDGYLQGSDDRIVLVLSSIELPSGKTLWQEEFVGNPEDPQVMQARIAANVSRYFNESSSAIDVGPRHPKAYQAYLKGLHVAVFGDVDEEIYWVKKALAVEPEWVEGWRRLVMDNVIAYHVTRRPEYAESARQAMAKLERGPSNLFHEIYYTAYIEQDFDKAEQLARGWVLASNHPYAIYAYARLMQESGLHREAARAFQHFTEEVPNDPAGWAGLYLNLLLTADFASAKVAADRYAQLLPLRSGEQANRPRMLVALLSGDIDLAAELFERRGALEEQQKPGSFMYTGIRSTSSLARFLLAVVRDDLETAETIVRSFVAEGANRRAALGYLRLGDETAAAEQFNIVKAHETSPGLFLWASGKVMLEPTQFRHPLILDYEAHLGIGARWRRELCSRAARMPRESYLDCDPTQLDYSVHR